jgi:ArsR family transcriptional regulator
MPEKPSSADLKFRAFSDQTRLRILHLLIKGEMCVCEIVKIIRVPQPTASRHLAYLRKAGLVSTQKRGLWTFYSLVSARTALHRNLLTCLRNCFEEVSQIRLDTTRQSKLKKNRC